MRIAIALGVVLLATPVWAKPHGSTAANPIEQFNQKLKDDFTAKPG